MYSIIIEVVIVINDVVVIIIDVVVIHNHIPPVDVDMVGGSDRWLLWSHIVVSGWAGDPVETKEIGERHLDSVE